MCGGKRDKYARFFSWFVMSVGTERQSTSEDTHPRGIFVDCIVLLPWTVDQEIMSHPFSNCKLLIPAFLSLAVPSSCI